MAKDREAVCRFYIALGQCSKGRDACHKGYCQHCNKYVPRAKFRMKNKKKEYLRTAGKGKKSYESYI